MAVDAADRASTPCRPDVFNPGEEQCRWCKASDGLCKAEAQHHLDALAGDFVDLTPPLAPQTDTATERITVISPKSLQSFTCM